MKFKIPILYIDELIISRSLEIRLIRNIARCVAMPCVMASTNSKVNNLIVNLSNESSYWNKSVWVQVARKLANAKITTIFKTTVVNKNIKFDYFLNRRGKFDSRKLLKYFAISFDNNSLETFERMIFIMMRQCQTSISGVTFYSFDFLIQALKLQANSILDCSKIWNHICLNRFLTFEFRKPTAFKRDGPFYSLRAFSTTSATITSETEDTRSVDFGQRITFAECSINEHFYYFGYPEERNILKFKYDGTNLVDTNGTYYVKSYFPPFQDDIFTHLAIWYKLKSNTSVGSVVSAYKRVLLDITPNINSMSNDFRSQENVAYWSIAHSTHQNFNGNTEGALFFTNVVKNFQSFDPNVKAVETAGTDSIPLGLVSIKSLSVPTSLQNFLEKIKVPYLLPSKLPNLEFGGDMVNFEDFFEGFCNFGVCSRCTNQMGLDVCFDLFKDGEMRVGYVECKYTKLHKTTSEVLKYVQRAGEKRSPLTFYMSYELNSDLKEHHSLQKHVQTCDLRQSTIDTLNSDFNTNIYCVYYESEKTLSMVALREFDDPDSVFIIVETNFQAPKV